MKKILSFLLINILLITFFPFDTFAVSNGGYFVVTAYYSPLPNQKYYLTGNYKDEIRLNGRGIRGASGKGVFSGMLAGPKNYKFGTKIQLEGLGVGSIEDRGGAIVNAGNRGYSYDRIDLWVGYGDEGLRRALYWGKRTIKGNIISSDTKNTIDYKNIASPLWVTKGLKKVSNIFQKGIGKNSNKNLIKKLQEFLYEINLYNGKIDGIYNNDLMNIIYKFQINNKILKNNNDYGAGYWGVRTRNLFLKKYLNGEFDKKERKTEIPLSGILSPSQEKEAAIYGDIIIPKVLNNNVYNKKEIKELQKVFKELGFYNGQIDGSKKSIMDTVYDYQFNQKIVTSVGTVGAGNFGPKTRESLKKYYRQFKEKELKIIEQKKEEQEKIKIEKLEQEKRKKELEEKYKNLEELSIKKANNKIEFIGTPKYGEISHGVRELQKALKDLGYFKNKDTAIFGYITKQSITSYQIDKEIIGSEKDLGAGIYGPKTKEALKNDLKETILDGLIKQEPNLISKKIIEKEFVIIVTSKI